MHLRPTGAGEGPRERERVSSKKERVRLFIVMRRRGGRPRAGGYILATRGIFYVVEGGGQEARCYCCEEDVYCKEFYALFRYVLGALSADLDGKFIQAEIKFSFFF